MSVKNAKKMTFAKNMKNDIIDALNFRKLPNYAYDIQNRTQKTHKDAVC